MPLFPANTFFVEKLQNILLVPNFVELPTAQGAIVTLCEINKDPTSLVLDDFLQVDTRFGELLNYLLEKEPARKSLRRILRLNFLFWSQTKTLICKDGAITFSPSLVSTVEQHQHIDGKLSATGDVFSLHTLPSGEHYTSYGYIQTSFSFSKDWLFKNVTDSQDKLQAAFALSLNPAETALFLFGKTDTENELQMILPESLYVSF